MKRKSKEMKQEIKQRIEQINNGIVPEGYKKTKLGVIPYGWEVCHLNYLFSRLTRKNKENNNNVLTISAQKGLISQTEFFNKDISSDDKSNYYLLEKGDFAYNKSYSSGYPYGAIKELSLYDKGIVSPLYICMQKTRNNKCPSFYLQYFEAGILNREIKAFAQEGARNHGLLNIAIGDFFNSNVILPPIAEQEKIAEILATQDGIIELKQKQIEKKEQEKKYLLQKIVFDVQKDKNSLWRLTKLSDVLTERFEKKGDADLCICSVAVQAGVISQFDHLGKIMAAADTSNYNVVSYGDVVYTKSPTGKFPYGIVKQSHIEENVAVSPLYGVFKPINNDVGYIIHEYFSYSNNCNRYLHSIINKGAKNTINITNSTFISKSIYLPTNRKEQIALRNLFETFNKEIKLLKQDLEQEKQKKKALMQLLLTGIIRV